MLNELTIFELDVLRTQIKKTFFDCFGYEIYVSDYTGNTFYTSLGLLIEKTLGAEKRKQIPKEGWFIKFFNKNVLTFHASKIQFIREFIKAYNSKPFKIVNGEIVPLLYESEVRNLNIRGVTIINEDFTNRIENLEEIPKRIDFYTGKKKNNCQWYGIVKYWDFRREVIDQIKGQIKNCFQFESRVAAVVWGSGGFGKSTILRRVAIELSTGKFSLLWVDDLVAFAEELPALNSSEKFLIIIEDGFLFKERNTLGETILSRIQILENVRLIIGDRDLKERPYKKYVHEDGYFEITTAENEKILSKVISFNKDWQAAFEKLLEGKNIFKAPLYATLFILARTSEMGEHSSTKDIYSLYIEVLENDLKKVNKINPGLAKALYCWLVFYYDVIISWETLLKLSEFFNGKEHYGHSQFDAESELYKILFYYISFEPLITPGLENIHKFYFHHDLIIDGLGEAKIDGLFLDLNRTFDMIKGFIEKEEFSAAFELLSVLKEEHEKKSGFDKDALYSKIEEGTSFTHNIVLSGTLEYVYSLFDFFVTKGETDKVIWQYLLYTVIFYWNRYGNNCLKAILKIVIERGCTSKVILDAFDRSQADENYLVNELKPKFKNEFAPRMKDLPKKFDVIPQMKFEIIEGKYRPLFYLLNLDNLPSL